MRETLKKVSIKYGITAALFFAFATYPLPGLQGNPTGLIALHNHAQRYITHNKSMILAVRSESMETQKLMNSQFSVYLLQDRRLKILESVRLTDIEKSVELQKIMDELKKHEKRLDKSIERLEDLDSHLSGYGIAKIYREAEH